MTIISNTSFQYRYVALTLLLFAGVARAVVFPLDESGGDLVGADSSVLSRYEDTFIEIGRANNLGLKSYGWLILMLIRGCQVKAEK